jgi:superfamily II DNA/RNA helicase
MPFTSLGLSPALAHAAQHNGFGEPTPVQTAAIPAALTGRDLLVTAPTGSGKTAAFALPLLHALDGPWGSDGFRAQRRPRALVLVPTRELAAQVGEVLRRLAEPLETRLKIAIVFGGVSINPQMMALRGGADVVVATPGRLLDLVEHNALQLGAASTLVLDEADRLLDAGFSDEITRVVALLPRHRKTWMFSATFAPAVEALAQALLREPERIDVQPAPLIDPEALARIEQHAVEVDTGRRTQLLHHLMQAGAWKQVLVFVASQYATEHVAAKLAKFDLSVDALHGGQSQGKRTQVLNDFKGGRLRVVVATDMAARGLHIEGLPVVVNYDLPRSADDYLHRIGRTGRAGQSGLAVSFVSAATEGHFRLIEKRQGQRVPRERVPGFEPLETAPAGAANGGIKGKRKSKKDKLREAAAGG